MLVDKIRLLFESEMQEYGFAASRWASAWICHLAVVKEGSSSFWVKWLKWWLWKSFWRYTMGSSTFPWTRSHSVWTDRRTVPCTLHPGVWRGIPLYQSRFSPSLPFPQGTCTHKCMPGVIRLPKVENVRFSQVSRTCRCFKSKCYLNRNNEVFERIVSSVPFEWGELSLPWAFCSSRHLQLKPLPISYPMKKAGDFSLQQWWV